MTHKVKPNITVSIPDPSLLVIEQNLEDLGRLPWSKLSTIMEIRFALSWVIPPISKTRYQKTTRYHRSWMKLELFIKGVSRPGTWLALTEVTDYSTGSAFELVQKIIDPRYAGSATVLDSYPAPHSPDAKLSNDGLRQERMGWLCSSNFSDTLVFTRLTNTPTMVNDSKFKKSERKFTECISKNRERRLVILSQRRRTC